MQSFLESLNYYGRFIEDFLVYASVLYESWETDFHEIRREYDDSRMVEAARRTQLCHIALTGDLNQYLFCGGDQELHLIAGSDQELHPIAGGD